MINELVKKEIRKNLQAIHDDFETILNNDLPKDLLKLQLEDIEILVSYSKKLALEGESAIEILE